MSTLEREARVAELLNLKHRLGPFMTTAIINGIDDRLRDLKINTKYWVTYEGRLIPLNIACQKLGISIRTVRARMAAGMRPEEAIAVPNHCGRHKHNPKQGKRRSKYIDALLILQKEHPDWSQPKLARALGTTRNNVAQLIKRYGAKVPAPPCR